MSAPAGMRKPATTSPRTGSTLCDFSRTSSVYGVNGTHGSDSASTWLVTTFWCSVGMALSPLDVVVAVTRRRACRRAWGPGTAGCGGGGGGGGGAARGGGVLWVGAGGCGSVLLWQTASTTAAATSSGGTPCVR